MDTRCMVYIFTDEAVRSENTVGELKVFQSCNAIKYLKLNVRL